MISSSNKTFEMLILATHFISSYVLDHIFGKYLEDRKKYTKLWSIATKRLQKCKTGVKFGHLSQFLWTKPIRSFSSFQRLLYKKSK